MVLDIILVVLFLLMIVYGYKKGCIGIVANLVSLIIAFVLAYLLAGTVGDYMANTSWGIEIKNGINNKFSNQEEVLPDNVLDGEDVKNEEDKTTNDIVNKENITDEVVTIIQDSVIENTKDSIANKISEYAFTGLGFVIVFFGARIILWLAKKILEGIFELPILKTFNKLGGVVTAILLFVIEVSIILAVIKSISTMTFMTGTVNTIQSSIITKMLYDHNIFTSLILSKII